jgi:hypothetical protein
MMCSFDGPALILRLYGTGRSHLRGSARFEELLAAHFGGEAHVGVRQIVEQTVDLAQTSCGYAVPEYDYRGERSILNEYWEKRGPDGVKAYWAKENLESIDGLPTGFDALVGRVAAE